MWPDVDPFECAGEDDEVVGPAPEIVESGADERTTWRWWDERSELWRLKPARETLALRIYERRNKKWNYWYVNDLEEK